MICWKKFALLAAFVFGIACTANCQAQVDCLQYLLYDDGNGNYLYVADEYDNNEDCSDYETIYVWLSQMDPAPIPCGNCPELFINGPLAGNKKDEGVKQASATSAATTADQGFKTLPPSNLILGKNSKNNDLPSVKGVSFSKGITASPKGIFVTVKTAKDPITVQLFNAQLDYQKAGINSHRVRNLLVGFEMTPQADQVVDTNPLQPKKISAKISRKHSAKITYDNQTYVIVTKADLAPQ